MVVDRHTQGVSHTTIFRARIRAHFYSQFSKLMLDIDQNLLKKIID